MNFIKGKKCNYCASLYEIRAGIYIFLKGTDTYVDIVDIARGFYE